MAINASMIKSVQEIDDNQPYKPYKLQVNYIDGTNEYIASNPDELISRVNAATKEVLGSKLDTKG